MGDKKPHYHGHRERLRKRFLRTRLPGLAGQGVMGRPLTLVIPHRYVKEQAKALMNGFLMAGKMADRIQKSLHSRKH